MRKLVISLITTALVLVSFVTSTFAFIVISSESEVSEFDFNIEGYDGLLISLDGSNFQQDITEAQLKSSIARSEAAFNQLQFTGVTLKHNANKKIDFNTNKKALFVKDSISNSTHEYADASANADYIVFDLWFKVETNDDSNPSYNLKFRDTTYIDAEDYTVKLSNSLSTINRNYVTGETITVNPANSMRLGLSNEGVFTTYECNANSSRAQNLGSAAIEGSTNDSNNPSKNAMYTYYNNLHVLTPFTKASDSGLQGFSGIKSSYTEDVIDTFEYSANGYNVIKLTTYVWLEGWDADYLATVPTSKISVNLGFEIIKLAN